MNVTRMTFVPAAVLLMLTLPLARPAPAAKTAAPAAGLMIKAGDMEVGGAVDVNLAAGSNNYQNALRLRVAPKFGYFVFDGLELYAGFGYAQHFLSGGDLMPKSADFAFGIAYVLDLNAAIYPYLGYTVGFDFTFYDESTNVSNSYFLTMGVPLGVLIALSDSLALNVGVHVNFFLRVRSNAMNANVNNFDFHHVEMPMGYIGIQGFFNTDGT
jgi:hypothetical protein